MSSYNPTLTFGRSLLSRIQELCTPMLPLAIFPLVLQMAKIDRRDALWALAARMTDIQIFISPNNEQMQLQTFPNA